MKARGWWLLCCVIIIFLSIVGRTKSEEFQLSNCCFSAHKVEVNLKKLKLINLSFFFAEFNEDERVQARDDRKIDFWSQFGFRNSMKRFHAKLVGLLGM